MARPSVIESLYSDAGKKAAMTVVLNKVFDILNKVGYKDTFEVHVEDFTTRTTGAGEHQFTILVEFANKQEIEMETWPIFTEQASIPLTSPSTYKDYFTSCVVHEIISDVRLIVLQPDLQLKEVGLALEQMSKNIVDTILCKHCNISLDEAYTAYMDKLAKTKTMLPELMEMPQSYSSADSMIEQMILNDNKFKMQAAILTEQTNLANQRKAAIEKKAAKELRRKRRRFTAAWGM